MREWFLWIRYLIRYLALIPQKLFRTKSAKCAKIIKWEHTYFAKYSIKGQYQKSVYRNGDHSLLNSFFKGN